MTQQKQAARKTGFSPWMVALLRLMTATHVLLYRRSGGALGGRIAGNPVLLLTTVGRKTGAERTRPLLYLPDGERMVVVGSAGTDTRHPFWWLNLQANGRGRARVGRRSLAVTAELATGDERARLWAALTHAFPRFAEMQRQTARPLPVVILQPVREVSKGSRSSDDGEA